MLFVVERSVDEETYARVVEANNPLEAMQKDSRISFLTEAGRKEIEKHEVATVGIYEVGQTNQLQSIVDHIEAIVQEGK